MLLEILIGLGLFALGLLLTFGLFPGARTAAGQAKNLTLATNLARTVVEELKQIPYDNLADIAPRPVTETVEVNGVRAPQVFLYQVDVTRIPGRVETNAVVNVTWNSGGATAAGQTHSYRLQTILVPF